MAPEQDDFDPTQSWAALRLQSHVMQKGVQVGSVLGVLFSGAALAYRRKMDTALLFKSPCYGAAIGGILTGGMGALKLATMDEDGLYDRVHRLHYNAGQSRTDHFAQAGAALGAAAALALRSSLPAAAQTPTGIMGAAAVGVASGVVLHILTAPKAEAGSSSLKHKWQKMTHEVMTK